MTEHKAVHRVRLRTPTRGGTRTMRRLATVGMLSALLLPLQPVANASPSVRDTTCAGLADAVVSQHRVLTAESKVVPASA